MNKFYKVILLLITLIFLSTFNPNKLNQVLEKKNYFFEIKNIIILNNSKIEKAEIKDRLLQIYGKNIFLVKREDLEKPLRKIKFLEKIQVKKKYPNSLIIKIFETKPIAYIFKKNKKYILDSSSNLILNEDIIITGNLPNIFGEKAENNFMKFLNNLKINEFPYYNIENYYYFKIDRWDVEFSDERTIKFPSTKIEDAIKKSVQLLNRSDFEKYKIIDLRVDGKIIVE